MPRIEKSVSRTALWLLLGFFLLTLPARAQRDEASLTGTVLDPSSASIGAAQLALQNSSGEKIRSILSDAAGSFRFEQLAPGTYTLVVTHPGFRSVTRQVLLTENARLNLRLTMSIAVSEEQVTVVGENSAPQVTLDDASNQSTNAVTRTTLGQIPVFDQDYITTMSRFLDENATGTNGVTLVVNGVEANGPGVTASAIKDVKINNNPYSALFSRPGRARIEITTKGGTEQLHGSVNFLFRDAVFDATNAFAPRKAAEQRRYFEGSLTGPLSHNRKTTFLLSLDSDVDNEQAVVVAEGLNGTIDQNVPIPTKHFFGSGEIFRDLGNGDRAWIAYSYEQKSTKNFGAGGTVLPSAATDISFVEHEVNVGYEKVLSPRMLNNLHFLLGHNDAPTVSVNGAPGLVVSGAFVGGGAQADGRRTEAHFDGTDIVTYATRRQTIKFGVDIPDISRRGFDDFTNRQGTYYFANLADYQAGQPTSYIVQRGEGHVVFVEKVVSGIFEDAIQVRPNLSLTVGARYYWQNYFHEDPNNIAPRVSLAYAPGQNRKVVIRAGAGMFYDRTGPRPISDLLLFSGGALQRYVLTNPTYPVDRMILNSAPQSVVTLDPRARIPYTLQFSSGVERQIASKSTLAVNYVGARRMDAYRSRDVNAPLPPDYLLSPNPTLGQVRQIESEGYQKSNGIELTYHGQITKYFMGQAQYTLSKTYNDTSGITYFPADSYLPNLDWARADTDRRHKFDLLGVFEAKSYFHLGVAFSLYSGLPVNVTTGADNNRDGVVNDRPSGVPRNSLHGPGYANVDLNLTHDFRLRKDRKESPVLTVGLNGFNVLNHPNYVTYVGVLGSPFFGQPVAAQAPRRMQLNLAFSF